jgi:hypothetical protein
MNIIQIIMLRILLLDLLINLLQEVGASALSFSHMICVLVTLILKLFGI